MRIFLSRVLGFLRRRALDCRLDEELRFHIDMEAEVNRTRGMTSEEALCAAQRAFGGVQQVKEVYREQRGLPVMELLLKDLQYGCRTIRRSPVLTATAVLSLALGIGANTAIFSVIEAVMLRSLPVRSPDELVSVGDSSRPTALREGAPMLSVFSYPLYQRLRDENRVFMGLLASGRAGRIGMSIGNSPPEEVRSRLVSANYFEVLGVSPVLGRVFSAEEDGVPGASPVVVISYDYWERRFVRDFNILGRSLRLNGSTFTVIGVGPRSFTGEVVGSPSDIWIPLSMQPQVNPGHPRLDRRDSNWLLCIGRLKPGASIQEARAEMVVLAQAALMDYEGAGLSAAKLRDIRSQTVDVQPGGRGFSWIRKHDSRLLFTLMAVFGLVLVIACANVANLLLARATKRQKEIAMRLALGASRRRLVRQLLTETMLLASMGGLSGLLLAGWGSRVISRLASSGGVNPIPFDVDVHPNAAVLAFTAAVTVLTAILVGLVPALRSTRIDLTPALKENSGNLGRSSGRAGKVLVIGQLALSLVLLVGAGLFIRSLANLQTLDLGHSRTNLALLKADLLGSGYAPSQQFPMIRRLMERLLSVPGVVGVTVSENGLFSGTDSSTESLLVEGFTPVRRDDSSSSFDQVGPNYFQVVGVPIIAGRDFDEHDNARAPAVAIINDTMARFYFGRSDPLGKYIANGNDRYTIVGVVKDTKQRDLKSKPERRFYVPIFQSTDRFAAFHFEIRTRGDAARIIPAIRRELESFGRNLMISTLEPVRVLIDQSISGDRMIAKLSGLFGVLALILAATGLYGVISYATSRRTNEIGLRMALGADRGDVISMVLRETLMLVVAGFAVGLPAALAATRPIAATLVGVGASDPLTLGVASLVMLVVAALAGFVPAVRASRIDPLAALRKE